MDIIEQAAKIVAEAIEYDYESVRACTDFSQKFGDISSTIAFEIAKKDKKQPAVVASEIVKKISKNENFDKVEAQGPYINFYLSDQFYLSLIKKIIEKKGKIDKKDKKKIMVEYFDANTHKGVHIGHIRNISLGESICRILEATGNKVIRVNYQGDIGPHVAKCIWGFINIYNERVPKDVEKKGTWLGKVYAEASKKIAENKELEKEVLDINLKIYAKERHIYEIWKKTRQWCLEDFDKFYEEFGVNFDEFFFESQTENIGKEIVLSLLDKGIVKKDEGAIIIDLKEDGLGVCVLLTKEGYPLYPTKDLGLAKLKFDKYGDLDQSIHVVGKEQEFYFKQLFKIFEKAGMKKAAQVSYHLIYELVMLPEGKMSSREGTMVLYEDLRKKLLEKTIKEVEVRHPEWKIEEKELIAKKIALAAIKFSMLRRENNKVLLFNWEKALSLEGDSGPYLQYAYVRTKGITNKAEFKEDYPQGYKFNEDEKRLLKKLLQFEKTVENASRTLSPHILCDYLLDLASEFNKFYSTCRVLNAEKEEEKKVRLAIVSAVGFTLKEGLYLLGIETPNVM
ncbi:MAG: arginine--tRNA ligase [Candidatus Bilamarchaeaceae archaeon]